MNLEIPKKKFFFVRHGMTEWNEKHLCQGWVDVELSDGGRIEAIQLGETINKCSFSKICVSPLKRALETATILQNRLPRCEIQVIDELKERGWGDLEGMTNQMMYQIEEMEEKNLPVPSQDGVEDREVFKARVLKGINMALENEKAPLIVSHGRVFLVLCELLQLPLIRQIPNTTLIECKPSPYGWEINGV